MTPAVEVAGGASRERRSAGPLLSLVLGVLFIGGSVWRNISERRLQEHDVQSIAVLRHSLDSARATLAVMKTAADSARLSEQLRVSEYFIGRRAFHVPEQQESLDGWWALTGPGTISVAIGGALIVLGAAGFRRRK